MSELRTSVSETWKRAILSHYRVNFGDTYQSRSWPKGPSQQIGAEFSVLEFPPRANDDKWTYATCCMSQPSDVAPLELHLFSSKQDVGNVELLTMTAHYHRTGASLGLNHTVNIGRPWVPQSSCDHCLISLPYLFGPKLEVLNQEGKEIRFLWLLPITKAEREFKAINGIEALESRFETQSLNYLNPFRCSVV